MIQVHVGGRSFPSLYFSVLNSSSPQQQEDPAKIMLLSFEFNKLIFKVLIIRNTWFFVLNIDIMSQKQKEAVVPVMNK